MARDYGPGGRRFSTHPTPTARPKPDTERIKINVNGAFMSDSSEARIARGRSDRGY